MTIGQTMELGKYAYTLRLISSQRSLGEDKGEGAGKWEVAACVCVFVCMCEWVGAVLHVLCNEHQHAGVHCRVHEEHSHRGLISCTLLHNHMGWQAALVCHCVLEKRLDKMGHLYKFTVRTVTGRESFVCVYMCVCVCVCVCVSVGGGGEMEEFCVFVLYIFGAPKAPLYCFQI